MPECQTVKIRICFNIKKTADGAWADKSKEIFLNLFSGWKILLVHTLNESRQCKGENTLVIGNIIPRAFRYIFFFFSLTSNPHSQ